MSTTIERVRKPVTERSQSRDTLRQALLACGVTYAVLWPIVNDAIAATLYDGYSRMDQAVSELSATGAPTHDFLTWIGPVFSLLLVGFGLGIWRSAQGKRSLRIAGALVVAHGAMSFLWMFGPMSQREVIAAGGPTSADDLHLILSAATGIFVAAYVTTTAFAFGWVFRLYSALTILTAMVFGFLTSAGIDNIVAGDPTPYLGLVERVGLAPWLLWMAIVAATLLMQGANPQNYARDMKYRPPAHWYRRINNRLGVALTSRGLAPKDAVTLEVRGRRSGTGRRVPILRTRYRGQHYLVSLSGESEWVRNVRAARGQAVLRRRGASPVHLEELSVGDRAEVLSEYYRRSRERSGARAGDKQARFYFGLDPEPSLEDFQKIATRYPVFQILEP